MGIRQQELQNLKMEKPFLFKERLKSFTYAFRGIKKAVRNEHNLRIHLISAVMAVFLGFILKLNTIEWSLILVCIALVIAAELFNSALEHIVNLVSPGQHKLAGLAKDFAAAAVLVFSILSFLVGILVFGPKLYYFLIP